MRLPWTKISINGSGPNPPLEVEDGSQPDHKPKPSFNWPVLVRFRKKGSHGRRDGWRSPVADGLVGVAWRTEVDAARDARAGVPEADWGGIHPRAVLSVREVAEGEMASVGAAWQRERKKYDTKVTKRGPRFVASQKSLRVAQEDEKLAQKAYDEYLPFLDQEMKEEHFSRGITKEDHLRKYDTRWSVSNLAYWLVILAFTLAEFPLNEKVFENMGDKNLAYLIAFGLGVALIAAAHFVGVTLRRYSDMWESNLYDILDAQKRIDGTLERELSEDAYEKQLRRVEERIPLKRRGIFKSIRDFFWGRTILPDDRGQEINRQNLNHLRSSLVLAIVISVLVIITAFFLGFARAKFVQSERAAAISEAGTNARNALEVKKLGLQSGTEEDKAVEKAKKETESSQVKVPEGLEVTMYALIQILIFTVAAGLTYRHENDVVKALRQSQSKLTKVRRKRWLSDWLLSVRAKRLSKATVRRWARYNFRRDQAEAIGRYYRSIIDNYYSVNIQSRPDATDHGAEISSHPRPIIRYPGWMFEDLTIPESGITTSSIPSDTSRLGYRLEGQTPQPRNVDNKPSTNGVAQRVPDTTSKSNPESEYPRS